METLRLEWGGGVTWCLPNQQAAMLESWPGSELSGATTSQALLDASVCYCTSTAMTSGSDVDKRKSLADPSRSRGILSGKISQ